MGEKKKKFPGVNRGGQGISPGQKGGRKKKKNYYGEKKKKNFLG
jgi:hypothetical protein